MLECNVKGISLTELVISVTVVGVLAMVTAPLLIDFLDSFWLAQNQSSSAQVVREIVELLSTELREAVACPDSLRPYVYGNGKELRFYRTTDPSDSIKYFFSTTGGKEILYRVVGTGGAVVVPEYATSQVDFVAGIFTVDNGEYGYSQQGKVNLVLNVGKLLDITGDTTQVNLVIYSRNFSN